MDITELRFLLNSWATWKSRGNAFPNACNLGRLREATGGRVPGSRIPAGVQEIDGPLAALMTAMEMLNVPTVRAIYMRSHGQSLESLSEALGVSMTRLKEARAREEFGLLCFLQAKGF